MSGEHCSEHVKQNSPLSPNNICFVINTKQIYMRCFPRFCFTCSPGHSQGAKMGKHDPLESQVRAVLLLNLPLFSEYMNVVEGYRSLIVIFALSTGKVVKQIFKSYTNVHLHSLEMNQ